MASTSTLPWLGTPLPTPPRRPSRRTVRRRLSGRSTRRIIGALLVGLATWSAVAALSPAPPPHVVFTAAADLPAGHVLAESDVRQIRVAEDARPATTAGDATQIVGRRLARSVTAREIITSATFATDRELAPDERAVHVPVADPGALMVVRPGDRVDLAEAGSGAVVAPGVRVLTVDDPGSQESGHGLVVAVERRHLTALVPAMSSQGPGVTPALLAR